MAEERSSLGSGTEAEHISWVPGIEGRGLPASWTYDGNEEVRNNMTRHQYEVLMNMAHAGHLLRYMVSNARRNNVPFLLWLDDDHWDDYMRLLDRKIMEDQEEWEAKMRDTGYVAINRMTSRIILTNLSDRVRTVCLRSQMREGCSHPTESFYSIRPYQTDIICFCSGILREHDLDLAMIEVIPRSYGQDDRDVSHSLMKLTTDEHDRAHVLLLDGFLDVPNRHQTKNEWDKVLHDMMARDMEKFDPPSLQNLCITNLQGVTYRDTTICDILPPGVGFETWGRDILVANMALSNLNTLNGREPIQPWAVNNIGPFMIQVRGRYDPYVTCRHALGVGRDRILKRFIDSGLEPPDYDMWYHNDENQEMRY